MKKLFFAILFLSACQVNNASVNDRIIYGGDGSNLSKAQAVFSTKCTPCHSYQSYKEADFATLNLLVKGDIYSSKIFYKIRGSAVGGPEDMPPNGSLSPDEISTIRDWVEQ